MASVLYTVNVSFAPVKGKGVQAGEQTAGRLPKGFGRSRSLSGAVSLILDGEDPAGIPVLPDPSDPARNDNKNS